MLKIIISVIGDLILKWLGMKKEASIESENEALKGRSDSVEDSFNEQNKAKEAANEAKEKIEKQGSTEDIFGSKEWNGNKENDKENS